jgi:hypothetical protein
MRESFQRLLMMSEPEILPLNAQATRGLVRERERSQFAHLLRHFLERFFNHETASRDGDAKTRMVQIAFAAGLPPFVIATYLWPVYHPVIANTMRHRAAPSPPPYWLQVNHHFFFVIYSFVAVGIAMVFEWDLFFPDLLDLFVLKPLPVPDRRVFLARVCAIALFVAGFLFDANVFATVVLVPAIDPPNPARFLAGHILATGGAGLFAAVFVLALQGVLVAALGERLFRRISLFMQGLLIGAFVIMLLLFPVFSGVVPALLQAAATFARWCPPFWFLGVYERLMEGPSAFPIYTQLARIAGTATFLVAATVILTYPLAYIRRTRQLIEGGAARPRQNWPGRVVSLLVNSAIVRSPEQRAIFHYITQTLFRVARYRIYLVLYGGVGLAIVVTSVLRFSVAHNQVHGTVSADGLRASIGIVTFWAIAGLRVAFLSPGNQQGSWILHFVHGKPPEIRTALKLLSASKLWALLFVAILTGVACLIACAIAPPELVSWRAVTAQLLVATGLCLLLTDLCFLPVTTVAFTGEPMVESPNLAIAVAKYITFFPIVALLSFASGSWIERRGWRFIAITAGIAIAHWLIELRHHDIVRRHCLLFDTGDRDSAFLLQLDLREYGIRPQKKENQPTQASAEVFQEAVGSKGSG